MDRKGNYVLYERITILMILDIASVILSSFLAIYIRSEFVYDPWLWNGYLKIAAFDVVLTIVIFWLFNLYRSLWQYASSNEFKKIITAIMFCGVIKIALFGLIIRPLIPRSWYIMEPLVLGSFTGGIRYVYRGLRLLKIWFTR